MQVIYWGLALVVAAFILGIVSDLLKGHEACKPEEKTDRWFTADDVTDCHIKGGKCACEDCYVRSACIDSLPFEEN